MKGFLGIWLAIASFACMAQEFNFPKGFTLLDDKTGDLDKDGIAERVLVFNTPDTTEYGIVREIQLLKLAGNTWSVWKKSTNAILKSEEGGMMGDPFQGVEIKNGILVINFAGGSSWKWSYTDKYRFQNNAFELIGYTSLYGQNCEYWIGLDLNLVTGKAVYKKNYERCEDRTYDEEPGKRKPETETFYKKDIQLNLDNRKSKEIKIISPVHHYEMYL